MEEISLLSNWSGKRKITTTKTKGNGTAAAAAATTAQQWDKQQQLISALLAGKDKNAIRRNMQTQRRRRSRRGMALFAFLSWVALLQTANCQQQQQLFFPPQLYEQQGPSVEQQHRKDPSDSVSIRLIDEIMEIFVPSDSFSHRRRKVGQQPAMPIPYGLNRLLPRTARSRDSPSERVDYTEEETGQIIPATERRFSPIRHQSDYGVAETMDNGQQAPWANLARDLFGIFRAMETTTPTTTTTTTTTQMSLLERLMPKLLSPFGLGTTAPAPTAPPPLFPFFTSRATMTTSAPSLFSSFFRQEPPKREPIPTNPLVEPMAQLFGVEKKAVEEGRAQIDTGGQNFDRFVVREKVNPDNPFAAFVGGSKWNERGIKWEDGSIRLINKNGNSILGAETGVHDRSVNIPISRWLDIANGLVNFNQAQQDRVRRW